MFEWDVAVEIEYFYRKNGCRRSSFDSIVASGKGFLDAALRQLDDEENRARDILLIDMGCEFQDIIRLDKDRIHQQA